LWQLRVTLKKLDPKTNHFGYWIDTFSIHLYYSIQIPYIVNGHSRVLECIKQAMWQGQVCLVSLDSEVGSMSILFIGLSPHKSRLRSCTHNLYSLPCQSMAFISWHGNPFMCACGLHLCHVMISCICVHFGNAILTLWPMISSCHFKIFHPLPYTL
jgi:hypothetical protein